MYQHTSNHQINIPRSAKPRLIIIGGGFAGMKLAFRLKGKNMQVVLFDRNNYHTFQPLLYQVATAGLEPDSVAGPIRKQLEPDPDFFFRMAQVEKINTQDKKVHTEIGELSYDYLVIAAGSKTNFYGNQMVMNNAFALKKIPDALDFRHHILQNFEKAVNHDHQEHLPHYLNIVIAGGGPTGVEMAGALAELKKSVLPKDYPEMDFSGMKIILVEGQDRLLGAMHPKSSSRAKKYLEKFGVEVKLNTLVDSFDGNQVTLSDGEQIKSHSLLWASGVQGNLIPGLPEEAVQNSRILVDSRNRVKGTGEVFAIGDLAHMETRHYPGGHPMVAPVAIQQARVLGNNLIRHLEGKPMKPFKYRHKGTMATIGRNKAVVDLPGNITMGGLPAWVIWMFIHLVSIYGLRNKIVVLINWIYNYFTYDKGTRLIIRKFKPAFLNKKNDTKALA